MAVRLMLNPTKVREVLSNCVVNVQEISMDFPTVNALSSSKELSQDIILI